MSLLVFSEKLEISLLLYVTSAPVLVYYSSNFDDIDKWFGHLLHETAMTDFAHMTLACFIQAVEYEAASLLLPVRLRALAEVGHLRAYVEVIAPLTYVMRANIFKRGLLCIISDCAIDQMAAILALAHTGEADWTALDCLGGFLCDFSYKATVSVLEWHA